MNMNILQLLSSLLRKRRLLIAALLFVNSFIWFCLWLWQ